jgi:hypothetical protein
LTLYRKNGKKMAEPRQIEQVCRGSGTAAILRTYQKYDSKSDPTSRISKGNVAMATKVKGKNFSVDEEIQLCRSFLHVSKDAATGTNQSAGTFWQRVTTHFNERRDSGCEARPYRSLESKWSAIQHDVAKFCGRT